ncbi:hypothetical protein GCM10025882_11020 [Acinetobacter gyllenbergii]|uniref:DUF4810 domain-containing protein n=1 Tax=Acinetobacter gyllenbergii CIP 110306 = MTCC 11365 TaxID=1217657 RepID=A0A829HL71_9GAMM|nr:DUF4810 domain-containing protein [Acinetobacter gyllenbergii]EPF91795.1 hypothetical protein F957_00783 [Acinetobacter gyllenbergii CIP 110306 = MTCC 11365]EPH33676.1 Putative lipoprotein [Acinetobacter gyllenbergii CIP 110306 = MTCC 11365]ESK35390.1 hypothetical protein F987_04301 [Acinetobacter gyllenbergii NIPH 230]MCU4580188.1 DUF4810 domain-containing protein [Acinetobacter gyllenbergii]GMA10678.1 hypothetical protein GCM10025882_11020 [Acinetobacter gyllenbergii]
MKNIVCTSLISIGLVGCAAGPQPLYSWGSYTQQTYLMYNQPEKATPSAQIIKLEAEIEKAKAKNLAVPPGLYAHLGWLSLQVNNAQKAVEYFQLERQVYPESTVLMNRLLQKMNANGGITKP